MDGATGADCGVIHLYRAFGLSGSVGALNVVLTPNPIDRCCLQLLGARPVQYVKQDHKSISQIITGLLP